MTVGQGRGLVIVPALNEAAVIGETVEEIRRWAPGFDVLVIDDGSTDRTAEIAEARGAGVLRLAYNLGIGGAVQTGYQYALEHGYDIAVQVDGDGQHDAREISSLLSRLHAADGPNMVIGSRFLEPADGAYLPPPSRRAGIHIFSRVVSRICHQRVTDPTSGFRMVDRRGIELFARDYPRDYPEVEAIMLMHAHRLRSCEIPTRMRPRSAGDSTISSVQGAFYLLKVMLSVSVGLFRPQLIVESGDPPPVVGERSL
jgi:glycosyltransferase involved in cell wall biosynthesis